MQESFACPDRSKMTKLFIVSNKTWQNSHATNKTTTNFKRLKTSNAGCEQSTTAINVKLCNSSISLEQTLIFGGAFKIIFYTVSFERESVLKSELLYTVGEIEINWLWKKKPEWSLRISANLSQRQVPLLSGFHTIACCITLRNLSRKKDLKQ